MIHCSRFESFRVKSSVPTASLFASTSFANALVASSFVILRYSTPLEIRMIAYLFQKKRNATKRRKKNHGDSSSGSIRILVPILVTRYSFIRLAVHTITMIRVCLCWGVVNIQSFTEVLLIDICNNITLTENMLAFFSRIPLHSRNICNRFHSKNNTW